jgi:hypothetical protein
VRTSRTPTAKTLIAHFRTAELVLDTARERTRYIKQGLIATYITVPEFGGNQHFTAENLDYSAGVYAKENGLKGKPFAAFLQRIDDYKEALSQLRKLREDWNITSGYQAASDAEARAYTMRDAAWNALLAGLRDPKAAPAIVRFLARDSQTIEPWRYREALKRVAGKGARP